MGRGEVLAIGWGDDGVKVVLLDTGRRKIKAAGVVSLGGVPEKDRPAVLSEAVKKLGVRVRAVRKVLVVGRQQTTIKMVRLPSVKDEELAQMAGFQAVRHIPFSRDEISVDYEKIAVDAQGYTVAMLVIIPRAFIDTQLNLLKEAGLVPERALLSSQTLSAAYLNGLNPRDRALTHCLVDVGEAEVEVAVVHQGKLIFTRNIGFGTKDAGRDPQGQDAWNDRLLEELAMTLRAYRKQDPAPPFQRVVFTRGFPGLATIVARTKSLIGITPVHMDLVDSFRDPAAKGVSWAEHLKRFSFSGLVGACLKDPRGTVNLLPEEWQARRHGDRKRRELLFRVIVILGITFSFGTLGMARLAAHQDYLRFLKSRLAETDPQAKEVRTLSERLVRIHGALARRHQCLETLAELFRVVPQGVTFTHYTFDEGKEISLRGTTDDLATVFRARDALEKSELFEKVEVKYATARKRQGQDFADFQIDCPLKKQSGGDKR